MPAWRSGRLIASCQHMVDLADSGRGMVTLIRSMPPSASWLGGAAVTYAYSTHNPPS